ncbi:hypothetical protein KUCAC02_018466, partial [Chaenocephalus aceratus]
FSPVSSVREDASERMRPEKPSSCADRRTQRHGGGSQLMETKSLFTQHLAAAPVAWTNPQYFVRRDNKRETEKKRRRKWVADFPRKQNKT